MQFLEKLSMHDEKAKIKCSGINVIECEPRCDILKE